MLLARGVRVFVLANWKIAACISSSGAVVTCLCGHVFGNPQFKSGTFVQTSDVTSHRVEFDSLIVVTRNGSEYWLSKPDPFDSLAMQRLLRYLQENESVEVIRDEADRTRMSDSKNLSGILPIAAELAAANLTVFCRRSTDRSPSASPNPVRQLQAGRRV
jgi:hypothetical protein